MFDCKLCFAYWAPWGRPPFSKGENKCKIKEVGRKGGNKEREEELAKGNEKEGNKCFSKRKAWKEEGSACWNTLEYHVC